MMFSAVAGRGCPYPCGDTQTENCLRSDGHLEITRDTLDGVSGTSGALVVDTYAFSGCTSLTSVSMPKVAEIGAAAFKACTALTSVTMPEVWWIKDSAFKGSTLLTWVHMPLVQRIAPNAFGGTPYSTKNPWQDKTALKVQYSSLGC